MKYFLMCAVVIAGCGKTPVNVTVPEQPPATVEVKVPEQPAPQVVVPPPVYAKVENLNCSVETFGWKKFEANNCPDKHWVMTGHADNGIECAQQRVKCFVEGGE